MEPVTLAVVLTLLATKATEKVGEQIGEGAIAAAKHLLSTLKKRSPDTVKRLSAAPDPTGADVIDVEIIEEIKRVAAAEPEVQAALNETATAIEQDAQSAKMLGKLADKIGTIGGVSYGGTQNITQNITQNL